MHTTAPPQYPLISPKKNLTGLLEMINLCGLNFPNPALYTFYVLFCFSIPPYCGKVSFYCKKKIDVKQL